MNSDSSPMAVHSNRSPSPLSSRPCNPNPRTSENNSANRRSFSAGNNNPFPKPSALASIRRFDPTTPANSPADFARRRGEEKENDEKDQAVKALKHQSPVAKGCKNFMAPTISAASKFTPSPRKKVLVERNDPVRTSISLSDGKAMFFSTTMSSNVSEEHDSKPEMGCNQNQKTESVVDSKAVDSETRNPVSKPKKRVSFSDVPTDSLHPSESPLESVISKEKVDSSGIAPLDADPSLPPYDPKTNYLSPRPQFLHYKPNPRIGILLNKENGLNPEEFKSLEDDLVEEIVSENCSDYEGTEDSQSEDAQKEEMEVAPSSDMVIGMDEIEGDSHVCELSEPLLESKSVMDDVISGDDLVQKIEKKPRALFRLLCFSTLLMLLVTCVSVSVTRSSFHDEFVLKDLSNFYQQSADAAGSCARVKFELLSRHVNQLRISSLSYFSKLVNELGKEGEETLLQFVNLSELQRNDWDEEELEEDGLEEDLDTTEMDDTYEEELDTEIDTFEEETYEEIEEEFSALEDIPTTETEIDSDGVFEKGNDVPITEEETSPVSVELTESKPDNSQDIQSQKELMISGIDTKQWVEEEVRVVDQETEHEATVEVASEPDSSATTSAETILSDQSDVNTQSSSLLDSSFAHIAMGVSSSLAAVLAAAAFTYKLKKNPNSANVIQADHPLEFTATTTKHMAYSQNWETTEVDVNGGESSCPSEVSSSFQKSASCSMERKRRKLSKRDSLASSSEFSMGSPSYGSFTTYEKIPIKHGDGDEEIITPVRRSNRIRNHHFTATSPL